jgi:hypothetical protein
MSGLDPSFLIGADQEMSAVDRIEPLPASIGMAAICALPSSTALSTAAAIRPFLPCGERSLSALAPWPLPRLLLLITYFIGAPAARHQEHPKNSEGAHKAFDITYTRTVLNTSPISVEKGLCVHLLYFAL